MKENIQSPRLILVLVFACLIFVRAKFTKSEDIETILAVINIVSLYIVILDIAERIKKRILTNIEKTCDSKTIIRREKKKFTRIFYIAIILVNAPIIYIYFRCWTCNLGFDIISIVALALSLLDDEMVAIGSCLYRV